MEYCHYQTGYVCELCTCACMYLYFFYDPCAALAVFVRSPAAYEALKSFNILQLPSRATLQAYTGAFLHESGANNEYQVAQFLLHCQQRKENGKESHKVGVLIFDEVKVINITIIIILIEFEFL